MAYRLGSHGPEAKRIQQRLQSLGLYRGPIDGDFGGGTESAVKQFQRREGIEADGVVGTATWDRLFPQEPIADPSILNAELVQRCLTLTGTFETEKGPPDCFAGLSGDFDGQGISFGALQWNLGQGTLQPLLREMCERHADAFRAVFQDRAGAVLAMLQTSRAEQLDWARSIQHPVRKGVLEPWRGLFKALGRTSEFQAIETAHARQTYEQALALCGEYGLKSQRAAALMFDIKVQNGSIGAKVKAQILTDFAGQDDEVTRMRIVANRRAEASKKRWIEDVRARKLTIAEGEGVVHGMRYHLKEQFGIGLEPFE
jgi:hypothetical protein